MRVWKACNVAVFILLCAALVAVLIGCSSGADETSTTAPDGSSTSTAATTESTSTTTAGGDTTTTAGGDTTTTDPQLMSDIEKELGDTSATQHAYAVYLTGIGAADDDPRLGIFYGLRARTQALSCRSALEKEQVDVADGAMREVYEAMNEAQAVATGSVLQTLTDARAVIETLGAPSNGPERADGLLEQFVEALTPLMQEAAQTLSSTTTTQPATTTTGS